MHLSYPLLGIDRNTQNVYFRMIQADFCDPLIGEGTSYHISSPIPFLVPLINLCCIENDRMICR